jgi:hypothetical protein
MADHETEGPGKTPRGGPDPRPREKSLYLILAGIVAAGAVAWWQWLRSLPRER